jgi:SAM-dependent methyltransferase
MGIHYDEDYHKAIMAAGETSVGTRWHGQRERISRYKTSGAILDIGCSSGAFLGTMRGELWKLHGIEMEAQTAAKARATTGAEVFVGDAVDAPFAAESFDVITCFDLLEHVYQPRQFLMKVREWLKPGGIVYIALPNIDSWESRILGTYWFGLELPRHLFHFSPRSLRYVMKSLGFSEISIVTPRTSYVEHSVSYIASSVFQTVGGTPAPMSSLRKRSVPFRAARKVCRLSLLNPFGQVASWAGAGGSIEAIFERGDSPLRGPGSSAGETNATLSGS